MFTAPKQNFLRQNTKDVLCFSVLVICALISLNLHLAANAMEHTASSLASMQPNLNPILNCPNKLHLEETLLIAAHQQTQPQANIYDLAVNRKGINEATGFEQQENGIAAKEPPSQKAILLKENNPTEINDIKKTLSNLHPEVIPGEFFLNKPPFNDKEETQSLEYADTKD